MTQISDIDHKAQMADMAAFDEQMPCVGIFWYDPEDHTLFGVRKKELTPREVEDAAEKGKPFINYPQLHRTILATDGVGICPGNISTELISFSLFYGKA